MSYPSHSSRLCDHHYHEFSFLNAHVLEQPTVEVFFFSNLWAAKCLGSNQPSCGPLVFLSVFSCCFSHLPFKQRGFWGLEAYLTSKSSKIHLPIHQSEPSPWSYHPGFSPDGSAFVDQAASSARRPRLGIKTNHCTPSEE